MGVRKNLKALLYLASALILSGCMQAVPMGNGDGGNASSQGPGGLSASASAFQATLHPVLITSCNRCHGVNQGPLFAVSDPKASHDSVVNLALANLTFPDQSRLVIKVQGGHQGIPTTLATTLSAQIKAWSDQLKAAPTPTPTPTAMPTVLPTFESISSNILVPKCLNCHGPVNADAGIRYDSHTATRRTVVVGSPATSRLYASCAEGRMPRGLPSLSAGELKAISDWILGGALNN